MLIVLFVLTAVLLFLSIAYILQWVLADFLSYFLLAYLTKFGYSPVSWVGELSQVIATMAVIWLTYVLWKDFGKNRFQAMLKALQH